jgi:hypothetical protein
MHNSPSYLAHQPRPRAGDRQALFLVRYADATSATLRVSPGVAVFGPARIAAVAADRQANGELPKGKIVGLCGCAEGRPAACRRFGSKGRIFFSPWSRCEGCESARPLVGSESARREGVSLRLGCIFAPPISRHRREDRSASARPARGTVSAESPLGVGGRP